MTVAPIGLAKFSTGEGAIGSIEKEFDRIGFRLACAEDHISLEIAVGTVPQDMGRDERSFVVVPDRVGEGLVGWSRELIGTIDRLADGLGGLKTLEQSVDDEADFGLSLEERAGQEQSQDREEALHSYSLGKKS